MRGADLQRDDCHQCDKILSSLFVKIDGDLSMVSYPDEGTLLSYLAHSL